MNPESDLDKGQWQQWLNQLRNNSWNLELLVSGFSILLISRGQEGLESNVYYYELHRNNSTWGELLYNINAILYFILEIMLVSLVINVLLRGLWIGAVGLSSVKGKEINIYDRFAPRFQFLKYGIKHWDDYIDRLDRLCSTIFSFTFLSVFVFISFSLVVLVYIPLLNAFFFEYLNEILGDWVDQVGLVLIYTFIGVSFIYMVDFITLSWVKRLNIFDKVYYPLYRFMGIITLAFLYRDLYYHLIIKKYTRRFGLLVFPFVFISTYSINFYVEFSPYYPIFNTTYQPTDTKEPAVLPSNFYDDQRDEKEYIFRASIPSKFVTKDYLELFISYRTRFNTDFEALCEGMTPARREGLINNTFNLFDAEDPETPEEYLDCVGGYFRLTINDTLPITPNFMYYTHPGKDEAGFLNIIDISELPRGRNHISIQRNRPSADTLQPYAFIYFWK